MEKIYFPRDSYALAFLISTDNANAFVQLKHDTREREIE